MNALELITKMDWSVAVAVIGVAWAIGVPLIVRRSFRNYERIEELRLKRAIQLEAFKKGAITHIDEE